MDEIIASNATGHDAEVGSNPGCKLTCWTIMCKSRGAICPGRVSTKVDNNSRSSYSILYSNARDILVTESRT